MAEPVVVVLGMMSRHPYGGVVWQTLHYLVGLRRLGYDVHYVETHGQNPSWFTPDEGDDGVAAAAAFLADVLTPHGFADRWAYRAAHADGSWHGRPGATRLLRDAAVVLNLHGATDPAMVEAAAGRLVYLETDPVAVQLELAEDRADTAAYLDAHSALFTFAELYGTAACALPHSTRFRFLPTRQPVVLDWWEHADHDDRGCYTTIGNWRQRWRDVRIGGETYTWSKHHEFRKIIDLPGRTTARFELALTSCPPHDRRALLAHGWGLADALSRSRDPHRYRRFIQTSRGELTVAKDQNVRLRTGWFSDRSATYLAAGRPVITQDTGFGAVIPTGAGLFAFAGTDDILAALDEVEGDYPRHRAAAVHTAREYFSHDAVLKPLLAEVGL